MGRNWSTFNTSPQWGKIQGIPSDLSDGKINWGEIQNTPGTYTPSAHNHDAANITAGTLNISRIPTGTTGTTVALGNHNHNYATFGGNTFTDTQTIDLGIDSGLSATFRFLPGGSFNSRNWLVQAIGSGLGFAIRSALDNNTSAINYLLITRGGGVQLLFNGLAIFETTGSGARLYNLPTSAAGLPSGSLWRNNNVINIVP